MKLEIPSKNLDILKHLHGRSIIQVSRQILKSDMDLNDFEQMADGATEVKLDDDKVLHFYALPEINSIGIQEGSMSKCGDSYTFLDVTNNDFWKIRIGKTIAEVSILKSKYASTDNPSEFGIELKLESNVEVYFEYLDEEDFPDTIRLTGKYTGAECFKQDVLPLSLVDNSLMYCNTTRYENKEFQRRQKM
ncbi:MAG: hypothetical protein LH702_23940 [Phormidesmis sp. CAN_BIN44]|nr:hypothetical protein [Phormidesmis sp. CAN_BIN44]